MATLLFDNSGPHGGAILPLFLDPERSGARRNRELPCAYQNTLPGGGCKATGTENQDRGRSIGLADVLDLLGGPDLVENSMLQLADCKADRAS